MSSLAIMDRTGDTKHLWDVDDEFATDQARKMFEEYKKKGYLAYTVNARGDKGEVIREFDPEAGRIIMVPPMAGG